MTVHVANEIIKSEWTDYNKHLNMAYYVLIFDKAWEVILEKFNMGENSAKTTGMSTMMVESNIIYNKELKLDDEVDINLLYFDHDKKRLQYKFEMIHRKKEYLASTFEALALYVNLNTRKVQEFEEDKVKIMDDFILKNKLNFRTEDLKLSSKLKK